MLVPQKALSISLPMQSNISRIIMEKKEKDLIELAFVRHRKLIFNYIASRIEKREDTEDLVQDVFMRLLISHTMLREDSLLSYVLCITHNIIVDYQRRRQVRNRVEETILSQYDSEPTTEFESDLFASELERQEMSILSTMRPLRQKIYKMNRVEDLSIKEIALELNLEKRQVERQLYESRRIIREQLKICI